MNAQTKDRRTAHAGTFVILIASLLPGLVAPASAQLRARPADVVITMAEEATSRSLIAQVGSVRVACQLFGATRRAASLACLVVGTREPALQLGVTGPLSDRVTCERTRGNGGLTPIWDWPEGGFRVLLADGAELWVGSNDDTHPFTLLEIRTSISITRVHLELDPSGVYRWRTRRLSPRRWARGDAFVAADLTVDDAPCRAAVAPETPPELADAAPARRAAGETSPPGAGLPPGIRDQVARQLIGRFAGTWEGGRADPDGSEEGGGEQLELELRVDAGALTGTLTTELAEVWRCPVVIVEPASATRGPLVSFRCMYASDDADPADPIVQDEARCVLTLTPQGALRFETPTDGPACSWAGVELGRRVAP
ncbi:MAG: hypothetical protein M5U28_21080 [Sandaracinaceae bacterium]|nr:hypothetical protein [Sandaracinaceae bacterium]